MVQWTLVEIFGNKLTRNYFIEHKIKPESSDCGLVMPKNSGNWFPFSIKKVKFDFKENLTMLYKVNQFGRQNSLRI